MKIFLSAAEFSGDQVGARVAEELRRLNPRVDLVGVGGHLMKEAGVDIWMQTTDLGVVGLVETLEVLPGIVQTVLKLKGRLRRSPPEAALLISCEGLNVPLGWFLRRRGIRTVSYFPPQVWMWRRFTRFSHHFFDTVLAAFPEEYTVYSRSGSRVEFVGHYLIEQAQAFLESRPPAAKTRSAPFRVGLMPGSRSGEIRRYVPLLLDTVLKMNELSSDRIEYTLPLARSEFRAQVESELERRDLTDSVEIRGPLLQEKTDFDLALVASGTATLQNAVLGVPIILFYRISPITLWLTRLCQRLGLLTDDAIGLPNLLAGRTIHEEILQRDANPVTLARAATDLIRDEPKRMAMKEEFRQIRKQLGSGDSLQRIAAVLLRPREHSLVEQAQSENELSGAPGSRSSSLLRE